MLSAMYAKLKFISSSISLYFFGSSQVFFCVAVAMKWFVEIVKFKFSGILLKAQENTTAAVLSMLVSLIDLKACIFDFLSLILNLNIEIFQC